MEESKILYFISRVVLRDRMEIPQVLFAFPFRERGRVLRPAGNTKSEEKLEERGGGVKINLRKAYF